MDRKRKGKPSAGSDATCSSTKRGRRVKSPETTVTHMDNLPPEMMKAIFTFLSTQDKASVAMVSREWRNLVNDPTLWRDENAILNSQVTKEGLQSLAVREITHVSIRNKLTVAQLQELLQTVPSLEFLDLCNTTFTSEELTQAFSVDRPNLKKLRLPSTYKDEIFPHLSNLEVLYLPAGPLTNLTNIVPHLPRLRKLACRRNPCRQQNQMDMSILLRVHLPSLTHLCLENIEQLNDAQIRCMKVGLPNLQALCFSPRSVSAAGLQELAQITSLQELCWSGYPEEHKLRSLCGGPLQLKVLSIRGGNAVRASSAQIVARMTTLEELHLCTAEEGLQQLSQGLPLLKKLVLYCFRRDANPFMPFVARMSSLKSLHIDRAQSIENMELLQNLESLHVSNSTVCVDSTAEMPNLQKLSLSSCTLNKFDVEDLKEASQHLRLLNVHDSGISANQLRKLPKTVLVTKRPDGISKCLCQD